MSKVLKSIKNYNYLIQVINFTWGVKLLGVSTIEFDQITGSEIT